MPQDADTPGAGPMPAPPAERGGPARPVTSSLSGASLAILAVMLVQVICAAAFLAFFVVDVGGLTSTPAPYTLREIVQIAAGVGLVLSIVINVYLLRRILRRTGEIEGRLRAARGAFGELLDEEFRQWGLTPAEREVCLFALKGCSNGEIAKMTGKSEGTVKSQTNAVFRKAGVTGRIQLMSYFVDELIGGPLSPGAGSARTPDSGG
ncbi:LuxR C-terminal-related transcriptional regulator [Psychromarinibacter sp. C21-152]|uniref:LuxR C-terminal-related transcriptional regulator n=1 Tax=Psychromarinibacter sediminicola TaxID=3033385 RepID=A0AAE3NQF1_9RHOB|nr:LuxR family transcriptional regulator [Psychromarinibacter sediminicola]MDF0599774.1 LuxR C-terminal-related transcriptional regulator [Psychromarinibacter sediminicola]